MMKKIMERLEQLREKKADGGFSMIELAVVVVVIGILAAIAIPMILGMQTSAEQSRVDATAANVASEVVSKFVDDPSYVPAAADFAHHVGDPALTIAVTPTTASASLENFCVTVTPPTGSDAVAASKGPGCTP